MYEYSFEMKKKCVTESFELDATSAAVTDTAATLICVQIHDFTVSQIDNFDEATKMGMFIYVNDHDLFIAELQTKKKKRCLDVQHKSSIRFYLPVAQRTRHRRKKRYVSLSRIFFQ